MVSKKGRTRKLADKTKVNTDRRGSILDELEIIHEKGMTGKTGRTREVEK